MAENKEAKNKRLKVNRPGSTKKNQTIRERAAKKSAEKPRRIRSATSKLASPISKARGFGKREYHMPLPDNKVGRFLGRRVKIVPKYFSEAFQEVKLVTWPNRKDTIRLTSAVFIFSLIFAVVVGLLDFVLDKLFKELILK